MRKLSAARMPRHPRETGTRRLVAVPHDESARDRPHRAESPCRDRAADPPGLRGVESPARPAFPARERPSWPTPSLGWSPSTRPGAGGTRRSSGGGSWLERCRMSASPRTLSRGEPRPVGGDDGGSRSLAARRGGMSCLRWGHPSVRRTRAVRTGGSAMICVSRRAALPRAFWPSRWSLRSGGPAGPSRRDPRGGRAGHPAGSASSRSSSAPTGSGPTWKARRGPGRPAW